MFSDDLKYFISVSVRPGFGGLVSVSVRFGRNPKMSFRSDTRFVLLAQMQIRVKEILEAPCFLKSPKAGGESSWGLLPKSWEKIAMKILCFLVI